MFVIKCFTIYSNFIPYQMIEFLNYSEKLNTV